MSFEDFGGVKIEVQDQGSGSATLIFVHGFACDHHDWDAQVQTLSATWRVVSMDLPGHGLSDLPETASVEALAAIVCGVKDRHSVGPVILIGHSLGCRLVLEAFRQASADVAGIVLVDGSRMAGDDVEASVGHMARQLKSAGVHAIAKAAFEGMSALNKDPELGPKVMRRVSGIDADFAENLMLSITRWDAVEVNKVLASVDIPVLIIQSTHIDETLVWRSMDVGMTNDWTELVTSQVPLAELKIAPGIGHFVQLEAADLVSEEIGRLAARVSLRG